MNPATGKLGKPSASDRTRQKPHVFEDRVSSGGGRKKAFGGCKTFLGQILDSQVLENPPRRAHHWMAAEDKPKDVLAWEDFTI